MSAPTLLILAAGMGSRYGGLKQIEPMGPNGETLLDYSIYDAQRAGFGRVVFVIRRDFAEQFQASVGNRFAARLPVAYAYQELTDLPSGFSAPSERVKPWGTGHAIWAARHVVAENFCVINADDFYGAQAYTALSHWFSGVERGETSRAAMVGYPLRNTLSTHGSVSRGLCTANAQGRLQRVEEMTKIFATTHGAEHRPESGSPQTLSGEEIVSLNFWGFTPAIFATLEKLFIEFLAANGTQPASEFFIPSAVDALIARGELTVDLLQADSPWFGVTYREDKPSVQERLRALIEEGVYSTPL